MESSQYLRVAGQNDFDLGEEGTIFVVAQGHSMEDWRPIISKKGEKMAWVGNSEK